MQLEPSTEACPGPSTKMDGIKVQRANSRKRKFSTGSDSDSSTEMEECDDRWSYRNDKAIAVQKYGSFGR